MASGAAHGTRPIAAPLPVAASTNDTSATVSSSAPCTVGRALARARRPSRKSLVAAIANRQSGPRVPEDDAAALAISLGIATAAPSRRSPRASAASDTLLLRPFRDPDRPPPPIPTEKHVERTGPAVAG